MSYGDIKILRVTRAIVAPHDGELVKVGMARSETAVVSAAMSTRPSFAPEAGRRTS